MYLRDRDQQTICAVSTPHGVGGISVIRISGPNTLNVVRNICPFLPFEPETHKIYFGTLLDNNKNKIDEVLCAYFKKGHSFTGEEVIEISCHGSPTICDQIIQSIILFGGVAAERGEFTYRAFLNGKLDLVQAESVLSLIESQSKSSAQLALRQLKGELSNYILKIEDKLTWVLAHIEAGIDFSAEGIDVVDQQIMINKLKECLNEVVKLTQSYSDGKIISDGFKIVLAGQPNVGKSSLLNNFLQEQRAIVTNIAGTTRDTIHGDTQFNGFKFTFVDTAGLRDHSQDEVEKIGIQRSYAALQDCDAILFVYDFNLGLTDKDLEILNQLDPKKTLLLANKTDLNQTNNFDFHLENLRQQLEHSIFYSLTVDFNQFIHSKLFFVSALDHKTRDSILGYLSAEVEKNKLENTVFISHSRHFENLVRAETSIQQSVKLIEQGLGAEFVALELKEALMGLHEILGRRFDDQIMDRVFKEFCIGK